MCVTPYEGRAPSKWFPQEPKTVPFIRWSYFSISLWHFVAYNDSMMERFMAPSSKLNPGSFSIESCWIFTSILQTSPGDLCMGLRQSGMRSQPPSAGSFLSSRYSDHQSHYGEDWFTSIPDCLGIMDASQWEPTLGPVNNGVRQVWDLLSFPGKSSKPSIPCFSDGGIIGIRVDVWEPMFHTQQ